MPELAWLSLKLSLMQFDTVVALEEVIKLVHAGYRCPDAACAGHQRTG
jgi:hypothetical protein